MATLRETAVAFFDIGVRAADPARAVHCELGARPLAPLAHGTQHIIAIGKAACAMARAALHGVPDGQATHAIAVTNYENAVDVPGCTVFAAAHPVPDAAGLKAAQAIMKAVGQAGANDHVLCLISGGGSALVPAPADGVSLKDKIDVNKVLLGAGFDIVETNLVRQALSKLKGGGLARMAAPAPVRSLIISDVIGDNISAIASGPTAPRLGTHQKAVELLRVAGVWDQIPPLAQQQLNAPADPQITGKAQVTNTVICSNAQSLAAMADAAQAWHPRVVTAGLCGDVSDAAAAIWHDIRHAPSAGPQMLIWGGETTVTLKGTGQGGRNQELALRVAQLAQDLPGDWLFLSGGTDGRDGPTDAAGGMVDAGTLKRLAAAGIDFDALLANNDSYNALRLAGDLFVTGPTGTNVADVQIFLKR